MAMLGCLRDSCRCSTLLAVLFVFALIGAVLPTSSAAASGMPQVGKTVSEMSFGLPVEERKLTAEAGSLELDRHPLAMMSGPCGEDPVATIPPLHLPFAAAVSSAAGPPVLPFRGARTVLPRSTGPPALS